MPPDDRRLPHYNDGRHDYEEDVCVNPLRINRAPKLVKAEEWPWFEQAFRDYLGCYPDYLREIYRPLDFHKQQHVIGALTQCVEEAIGRRKLIHLRKASGQSPTIGFEAWQMLKEQYSGNTTARQSELHDKMTDRQKKSENMEAYLDRVTAAALDLEEIGAPESDVGLKNLIFKGLLPEYVPSVTHIHLNRSRLTLDQYKDGLLEAGRIYEHTLQRKVNVDTSSAYFSEVPDPFGSQLPPASPIVNSQRIDGPTQVGIRDAFRDFLKTHLPDAAEEQALQMERMFSAMLPRTSRAQGQQGRPTPGIICYSCGDKGHRSFECPRKDSRQRRSTQLGPRDVRQPTHDQRYKEQARPSAHLSAGGLEEGDWEDEDDYNEDDEYCAMAYTVENEYSSSDDEDQDDHVNMP
jgi:gag-polypeptide of LTR copia-type/Zinc knuckle